MSQIRTTLPPCLHFYNITAISSPSNIQNLTSQPLPLPPPPPTPTSLPSLTKTVHFVTLQNQTSLGSHEQQVHEQACLMRLPFEISHYRVR